VIALGACTARQLAPPQNRPRAVVTRIAQASARLDVLFAIDTSSSMRSLVENMSRNFPAFMQELQRLPGGIPDLHVAVVSSDLGAGIAADVCPFDGDAGRFQVAARPALGQTDCPVPSGSYITATADGTGNNFAGEIPEVFACIANLTANGERTGCGFEHQIESVRRALGGTPGIGAPPENDGFLRPNVPLAVVWLTNEDDCSAPPDSAFFARDAADGQGLLTEFRCNEFGHTCNGRKLDRASDADGLDCRDAAGDPWQRLVPISEYVSFFQALKPDGLFVPVVIAAPPVLYGVRTRSDKPDAFTMQLEKGVVASCGMRPDPNVFGDPAVRMFALARAFGDTSFPDICAPSYSQVMGEVGRRLVRVLDVCIEGEVADGDPALPGVQPDCVVGDRQETEDGRLMQLGEIPPCSGDGAIPAGADACWQLVAAPACEPGRKVDVRRAPGTSRGRSAAVSCALVI
jgi:hypothetical protein